MWCDARKRRERPKKACGCGSRTQPPSAPFGPSSSRLEKDCSMQAPASASKKWNVKPNQWFAKGNQQTNRFQRKPKSIAAIGGFKRLHNPFPFWVDNLWEARLSLVACPHEDNGPPRILAEAPLKLFQGVSVYLFNRAAPAMWHQSGLGLASVSAWKSAVPFVTKVSNSAAKPHV